MTTHRSNTTLKHGRECCLGGRVKNPGLEGGGALFLENSMMSSELPRKTRKVHLPDYGLLRQEVKIIR